MTPVAFGRASHGHFERYGLESGDFPAFDVGAHSDEVLGNIGMGREYEVASGQIKIASTGVTLVEETILGSS